jgi:hypothetical protein
MTLPRTLLEDEEATQFVCRGYWDEMLSVAGGTPAEEPMVSWYEGSMEGIPAGKVYVHIIGYAEPAMSAEEVLRSAGFSPFLSRYVSMPEPEAELQLPTPTYTMSELIERIGSIAEPYNYQAVVDSLIGAQISINVTGPWVPIREVDDDEYRYRPPTGHDFITHPQQYTDDDDWEWGNDVAKWYPEMEVDE